MNTESLEIVTGIDFAIRSSTVTVKEITELMGLNPTRSFDLGAEYLGTERGVEGQLQEIIRKRPWTVWHLSSNAFINDNSIEKHALFLIDKLKHAEDVIKQLVLREDCSSIIRIWYVGSDGFYIPSSTVTKLASLCQEICVTCWDVNSSVN